MKLLYLYSKLFKRLHGTCVINSLIDKSSLVGINCNIVGTKMGRYSYCGSDCQIVNTDIGSFCSISDHVFIGGAEHPMNIMSSSPVFQDVRHSGPKKRFARYKLPKSKKTIIGNDVWIGHAATIRQGVFVGDGAVIGSNALVTKDVPQYAIVGGVPARIIKFRFSQEIIARLKDIQWWSLPDEEITKRIDLWNIEAPTLEDLDRFFPRKKLGGGKFLTFARLSCRFDSKGSTFVERRVA